MFGDVDSGSAKQELSILLIALHRWRQVIEKRTGEMPIALRVMGSTLQARRVLRGQHGKARP